jgi:hypothetical protein
MKTSSKCLQLALAITALSWIGTAMAETPYERDQREQMEKARREHRLSPQVEQAERWKQEWRQQHPNEPMPSFGVLEKLHEKEIIANTNRQFAVMRQQRQAELQRNYLLSKQHQQALLAAAHITWTPQQWQQWDREYDLEQQRRAQDYLKASALAGEMARQEAARDEAERMRKAAE